MKKENGEKLRLVLGMLDGSRSLVNTVYRSLKHRSDPSGDIENEGPMGALQEELDVLDVALERLDQTREQIDNIELDEAVGKPRRAAEARKKKKVAKRAAA